MSTPAPTSMVDLLKSHLRTSYRLIYLGTEAGGVNHPDRALPKPIWTSLATAHPDRIPHDQRIGTGQNNRHYASFRDVWLPQALREIRAEDTGVAIEDIEPTEYAYKKGQVLSTGGLQPRRIIGWCIRTQPTTSYDCGDAANILLAMSNTPNESNECNTPNTPVNTPDVPSVPGVIHGSDSKQVHATKKRPRGRAPKGKRWSDSGGWVAMRGKKRARSE